jgi:hypothetical protein
MQTAEQAGIRKLYHYEMFDPKHLADSLANNRIHVSNIENVNDPWDCRPWFDRDVSESGRRREWAEFFSPLAEYWSEEERIVMARMTPPWTDNEAFLAKSIDDLLKNVAGNTIQRWRMYCLTPDADSILMWSHYSGKHTGICLEFSTDGNFFGGAREVTYRDNFLALTPALLGDGKTLTNVVLLTKSQAWNYEHEYRLLCRPCDIDPEFSLQCDNDFLSLPPGVLTAVIVGAKCSDANRDAIQTLIKEHAPHVVVKRAICTPHKYQVSIIP